ncbi:MAG: hypothetical protein LBP59_05445 [Planctomycetaceae bacterium]|jgi:Flp pilus assembly protein TadD|nr:hypothetical protein [Planctomycetaceae bacterium]
MTTPLEQYDSCIEHYRNGNISEATAGLHKLTETAPDFALTYNALGALAKRDGKIDEAIKYAENYCKLAPTDPFGFTILSAYYIESGNRKLAEDAIAESIAIRIKQQQQL